MVRTYCSERDWYCMVIHELCPDRKGRTSCLCPSEQMELAQGNRSLTKYIVFITAGAAAGNLEFPSQFIPIRYPFPIQFQSTMSMR